MDPGAWKRIAIFPTHFYSVESGLTSGCDQAAKGTLNAGRWLVVVERAVWPYSRKYGLNN